MDGLSRISRRAGRIPSMELAGLLRTAAVTGAIDIAVGLPPGQPPERAVSAAMGALRSRQHQYADPAGLPALRAAIADGIAACHGVTVDPDEEITVTCGATEAILVALLTVTDPGDEVIVLEPYFEVYPGMVRAAGAIPVPVPLSGDTWRLDLSALRRAITPLTRALLLNTPHNPTGRCFDAGEVGGVLELCAEFDLTCIVDEVYGDLVYDGVAHVPPMRLPHGREFCVVAGSLSKSLRMSGWRIGYCVAAPAVTTVLRRVHERTTMGTSHPLQVGAAASAAADRDPVTDLERRRNDMVDALAGLGFQVHPPQGGYFVFGGTAALGWSSSELAHRLLPQAGVLVAPGGPFFSRPEDGQHWIRATFVRDERRTTEALERIGRFLHRERPASGRAAVQPGPILT